MTPYSVSKLKRTRGYEYERSVVQRFNYNGWKAYRLGGSTTTIPDILAFSSRIPQTAPLPDYYMMYAIECKTGGSTILKIPPEQVDRCYDICDSLEAYHGIPVGAFRFHTIPLKKGGRREAREYLVHLPLRGREYRMTYDGELTSWLGRGYIRHPASLARIRPPWEEAVIDT